MVIIENNINTTQITDRMKLAHKNTLNYQKKMGKAYYLKFLEGENLTRDQAIKEKCYECVLGEDTACPQCTDGVMIQRTGKYESFLGCSNYRKIGCRHTERLN